VIQSIKQWFARRRARKAAALAAKPPYRGHIPPRPMPAPAPHPWPQHSRRYEPPMQTVIVASPPTGPDFVEGLILGELLSSRSDPCPEPDRFSSGGGGDFGGGGASGSWDVSPSPSPSPEPAPSPTYDDSSSSSSWSDPS
jgi:hypothetical protein